MRSAIYLFGVLLLTAYGQLIVKARAIAHSTRPGEAVEGVRYLFAMFTDVLVLSGLIAAIVASGLWMLLIARVDLAYAYPFMALTFVLVPLGSAVILNETLPPLQFIGLGLIVAGVCLSAATR